jgi:HEAT repeat protein
MRRKLEKLTSDLAQGADVKRRRRAAEDLRDLGFARRLSLEKRGSLGQAAQTPLTDHELDALAQAVADEDREVRRHAIVSAGDLADARLVPALIRQLQIGDEEIKLAVLDSLGDIGGIQAITALTELVCSGGADEELRLAALTELEELAAKQITSGPDRRFDPAQDPVTAAPDAESPDEAEKLRAGLLEAVVSIQAEESADDLLQLKAGDIQAYLESGLK